MMTWHTALRLGRVSNLPTVWTNVLAAAVLADASSVAGAVAVGLACSLAYVGGMFLNDAFDAGFDAKFRPERPIPSGAVTTGEVFAVGFGLLGLAVVAIAVTARLATGAAWDALRCALTLAALIVLYDGWHKSNPLAPILMGLCRTFVYVTTAVALTGGLSALVGGAALVQLCFLIGLTYVARQERIGSSNGIGSLDTLWRWWPFVALSIPFVVWSPSLAQGLVGLALYAGAVVWVLRCLSHLGWRARLDVPRAVVGLIAAIALVDGLALASAGHTTLALAALPAFALTLALQRWVSGT
jgi:4-hydroxybenzoate polyprenyltransferase